MSKRDEMIGAGLVRNSRVLEFGPLASPMVAKSECHVVYLDHVDTQGLRSKYDGDSNVDVSSIQNVDIIWDGMKPLQDVTDGVFDVVIASHVFEHSPNPIFWLQQCGSVLRDGGTLGLALPDKRFTFDYFRPLTTLGDWIAAHLERRHRPSPQNVFDIATMAIDANSDELWKSEPKFPAAFHERLRGAIGLAQRAMADYIDVHCTVCTPRSFRLLLQSTAALDLHDFRLESLTDTMEGQLEFFVRLSRRSELTTDERAASFTA